MFENVDNRVGWLFLPRHKILSAVLLQVNTTSMQLSSLGLSEGPNTAGLMICVLHLMKEAELAVVCDYRLKFQIVCYTITDVSKERTPFIFLAKQYRNCSSVTALRYTKILRCSRLSEMFC